ncbi:hypothetical protein LTS18_002796 [Coniosporium uncinatum]|uniref:Uncharacterized protein n=1 Tax=Coniosporium uncinatum TaxID=93489 RepID=A0ACC3DUN4_9PEZI|nr:hypothetical protein LTS18_002796 [Coniosporium uncinatum]
MSSTTPQQDLVSLPCDTTSKQAVKRATFSDQLVQDLATSASSSPSSPERKPLKPALRRRSTFNPSRTRFTDLPGEIRNRIYHCILDIHIASAATTVQWPPNLYQPNTPEHERAERTRGTIMPMNPTSAQHASDTDKAAVVAIRKLHVSMLDFLLANKQIRKDFTPLYLQRFTFLFSYEPANFENLRAWVSSLGADARHLRSVSVTLDPALRAHGSGSGSDAQGKVKIANLHSTTAVERSLLRVAEQGLRMGNNSRTVQELDAENAVWRRSRVGPPIT